MFKKPVKRARRQPDKLIPYRRNEIIGVYWKDGERGVVEDLHFMPCNLFESGKMQCATSKIEERDGIRFRVYISAKDDKLLGAVYEPLEAASKPSGQSSSMDQAGSSNQVFHQPSPSDQVFQQHGSHPPTILTCQSGVVHYDNNLFALYEDPFKFELVDIRHLSQKDRNVEDNFVPTYTEMRLRGISEEHVKDHYPRFAVYKENSRIIGSRLLKDSE